MKAQDRSRRFKERANTQPNAAQFHSDCAPLDASLAHCSTADSVLEVLGDYPADYIQPVHRGLVAFSQSCRYWLPSVRYSIAGAVCWPWHANVKSSPIPAGLDLAPGGGAMVETGPGLSLRERSNFHTLITGQGASRTISYAPLRRRPNGSRITPRPMMTMSEAWPTAA